MPTLRQDIEAIIQKRRKGLISEQQMRRAIEDAVFRRSIDDALTDLGIALGGAGIEGLKAKAPGIGLVFLAEQLVENAIRFSDAKAISEDAFQAAIRDLFESFARADTALLRNTEITDIQQRLNKLSEVERNTVDPLLRQLSQSQVPFRAFSLPVEQQPELLQRIDKALQTVTRRETEAELDFSDISNANGLLLEAGAVDSEIRFALSNSSEINAKAEEIRRRIAIAKDQAKMRSFAREKMETDLARIEAEFAEKLKGVENRRTIERLRFGQVRAETNLSPETAERRFLEIDQKFDLEREALESEKRAAIELINRATPFQNGGPLAAGQLALVGEAGPELFVPGTAGNVLKNEDTMAVLAAAGARMLQGGTAGLEALGGTGGAVAAGAGLFGALFGLDEDGKPLTPEGILEKAALVREGLAEQKELLAA